MSARGFSHVWKEVKSMFQSGLVFGGVIVVLLEFVGAVLYHVIGGVARERQRQDEEDAAEQERRRQAQAWSQSEVRREAHRQLAVQQEMRRMAAARSGAQR